MTSPDQPDPTDPSCPTGSTGPADPASSSGPTSPARPAPGEAATTAYELLYEAQDIKELIPGVARDVMAVAQRISVAPDRRSAARFAPAVLLAREVLTLMLEDAVRVGAAIDELCDALGTVTEDDHPEAAEARVVLGSARDIVQAASVSGRELAHIGILATERVSDFAEAEMLYEQAVRDLRRRDLSAVDERLARLVQLESVLVAEGVTSKLVEVQRRREELAAGGRGDQPGQRPTTGE